MTSAMIKSLFKWTILSFLIGTGVGVISFSFNHSLIWANNFREAHPHMIFALPIVGVLVSWFYKRYASEVDGGSNLILDEIHSPKKHFAFKMVPLIFFSTTLSHLFGASVGREGAAVQMGSGFSDQLSRFAGKYFDQRPIVLMAGMSAGFAAVFGTPLAGMIFGMEVLLVGSLSLEAFFPCMLSAMIAFLTTVQLGFVHHRFAAIEIPLFSMSSLFWTIIAGVLFGLLARLFLWALHGFKSFLEKTISQPLLRPFLGGLGIIFLILLFNGSRFIGLGDQIISQTFVAKGADFDFLGKIISTVISVGSGFRGGEVLPLFYMGSTFGNALSNFIPLSFSLLSALGFVSVFAGAANTPIAGLFLAFELFGPGIGIFAAIAIVMSYLFSGEKSLYEAQKKRSPSKL